MTIYDVKSHHRILVFRVRAYMQVGDCFFILSPHSVSSSLASLPAQAVARNAQPAKPHYHGRDHEPADNKPDACDLFRVGNERWNEWLIVAPAWGRTRITCGSAFHPEEITAGVIPLPTNHCLMKRPLSSCPNLETVTIYIPEDKSATRMSVFAPNTRSDFTRFPTASIIRRSDPCNTPFQRR